MTACALCGGFGGHHDPIAHDPELAEEFWRRFRAEVIEGSGTGQPVGLLPFTYPLGRMDGEHLPKDHP